MDRLNDLATQAAAGAVAAPLSRLPDGLGTDAPSNGATWFGLLFAIAWVGVPGSPLLADRRVRVLDDDRSVLATLRPGEKMPPDGVAALLLADGREVTIPQGTPWVSVLFDVRTASIQACDLLLSLGTDHAAEIPHLLVANAVTECEAGTNGKPAIKPAGPGNVTATIEPTSSPTLSELLRHPEEKVRTMAQAYAELRASGDEWVTLGALEARCGYQAKTIARHSRRYQAAGILVKAENGRSFRVGAIETLSGAPSAH
jgi:hypothetical protein